MAYTNTQVIPILGAAATGTAGDSVYKMTLPASAKGFYLERVIVVVTTTFNLATAAQSIVVKKTLSGGSAQTLATTGTLATNAAVGTTVMVETPPVTAASNHFDAGDLLDVQIGVTNSTTAGKVDIYLVVALDA